VRAAIVLGRSPGSSSIAIVRPGLAAGHRACREGRDRLSSSMPQVSQTQAERAREPGRSGGRVRPVALNPCIKADVAARTGCNTWAKGQFAGATGTPGACDRSAEQRPGQRSQQPEIKQDCREHPKALEQAHRVFGIEPDNHGREYSHQKPSKLAGNAQLQLKVFPHTHGPIVLAPAPSRLLSHPGDMSAFPNFSGTDRATGCASPARRRLRHSTGMS
jgi:hypothetical protein